MRFFINRQDISGDTVQLSSEDSAHISRVLRRREGDSLSLCDGEGMDYEACILEASPQGVKARITDRFPNRTEPRVQVTLYAGLSKGERFDLLIQKAVELGVFRIVPVLSRYCVVKLPEKEREKKLARMNKIALEACKQSLRGRVVQVGPVMDFAQAVEEMTQSPCPLLLYEKENKRSLSRLLEDNKQLSAFAVLTGPEGGFSQEEAALAMEKGLSSVSVGPRILRCETAPLAALCAIMYQTGNFDIGE